MKIANKILNNLNCTTLSIGSCVKSIEASYANAQDLLLGSYFTISSKLTSHSYFITNKTI